MTGMSIAEARVIASAAVGRKAWGTTLGVGSFLTVELGASATSAATPTKEHGEYHLWVYCSAWRIQTADAVVASSEDAREVLEKSVPVLDGLELVAVSIEHPSLSANFQFEGGISLTTFSIFSTDYEHWMLYGPGGTVLTAGPAAAIGTVH
jgi:hypothetical protein